MAPKIQLKYSKGRVQRLVMKLWPVAVVVMIVCVPFLVKQSYDQLKGDK
jgi:hypothetical protein